MPGHRLAFFGLDRLYRRQEKWPELVRLYEQQAPHTTDRALFRFLRQETARLWSERVPNSENAAAAFVDVWSTDERDIGPLFLMARVLEAAEKWDALAGALEQQTKVLRDDLDKIAVKQRLAAVLEVHLERPDDALAVHERVLELDSDNEVSLRALARLHHLAGRWREVIGIWTRQLAHCATAKERAALHYHIGRVHERKLGERDAAVAAYERALADDPLHASALRALDRILRRDRQWKQLCAALEKRANALADARQQALVLHEIAQIEELHLRDLEAAQKRYQKVQERHPQYETAAVALIHVAEARGDWKAAAAELARLIERTTHVEAKMALAGQLGLVYEHRLDDPARAAACYTQAIESSKIGRVFSLAELRATAASSKDAAGVVAPLRRLGARCTDIRVAHGYRALAALRDEVATGAAGPELYLDAGRLEQADPLVAQGIVRTLGGRARARMGRAHPARGAGARRRRLLERAGQDAVPLRGGAAARSRRPARGDERLRAGVALHPRLLAAAARAAAHRRRRGQLGERGDAAGARGGAGGRSRRSHPRAHDRQRHHAREAQRSPGRLRHYRRLLELEPAHEDAFVRARVLLEEQKDDAGWSSSWSRARRRRRTCASARRCSSSRPSCSAIA